MTVAVGTEEYATNLALGHLGQPEIASMSDSTTRARAARLQFPNVRRSLLRRKWWNFATGWISPAADTVAGIGPLKIRYPLPTQCLRVRFVNDAHGNNIGDDSWAVEAGNATVGGVAVETEVLVTNQAAPVVCITQDVTLPRLWDDLFLNVFACELASRLATKVGRSQSTAEKWHTEAEDQLITAAGVDSKEKAPESGHRRPTASFVSSRSYPRPRGFLR
jgi:hypothetical protein